MLDYSIIVVKCKDPYVGDGFTCTLDTDGDGYPDVNLDSCTPENQNKYCKKVSMAKCFMHGSSLKI